MSSWELLIVPVAIVTCYYYYTTRRPIDLDNLLSQDQIDNINLAVKRHAADTVQKNLESVKLYLEKVESYANLVLYLKQPAESHLKLTVTTKVRYITKTTLKKHSNWNISMMMKECDSVNLNNSDNNTIILPSEVIEYEDLDRQLVFLNLSNYWKLPMNTLDFLATKGIVSSAAYSSFSPVVAPGITPEQIVANCKIAEFELGTKSYINLNNEQYKNAWYYLQYNEDVVSYQVIKFDAYTSVIFLNGTPVLMSDYKTIFEDNSYDAIEAKLNVGIDTTADNTTNAFTIDVADILPSSCTSLNDTFKYKVEGNAYCKVIGREDSDAYYPYKLTERPELFQLVEHLDLVVPGLQGPAGKQGPPGVRLYTIPKKLVYNASDIPTNLQDLNKKMLYKFQKGLQSSTPSIEVGFRGNENRFLERIEIYQGYLKLSSFNS